MRSGVFRCLLIFAVLTTGSAAQTREEVFAETLDAPRLAREIFAETNRVRAQLGLPAFRADERVDGAAETQARIGHLQRPVRHTLPFPSIATPLDRVKALGLRPHLVAENIALLSVYDVPTGAQFYRLRGETQLRDSLTAQPLRRHDYASFAAAAVAAWMNSPPHRAHLVNPRHEFLGCAVQGVPGQEGTEMIFAVQVFFTPERKGRR